jgi:hypothetical protein
MGAERAGHRAGTSSLSLMLDAEKRTCLACKAVSGLAAMVSAIRGRPNIVRVHMVCGACGHEWTVEFIDRRVMPQHRSP